MITDLTKRLGEVSRLIIAALDVHPTSGYVYNVTRGFPLVDAGVLAKEGITAEILDVANEAINGELYQKGSRVEFHGTGFDLTDVQLILLERFFREIKTGWFMYGEGDVIAIGGISTGFVPKVRATLTQASLIDIVGRRMYKRMSLDENADILTLHEAITDHVGMAPYHFMLRTQSGIGCRRADAKLWLMPFLGNFGDHTNIYDASGNAHNAEISDAYSGMWSTPPGGITFAVGGGSPATVQHHADFNVYPGAGAEQVVNGGFEDGFNGWTHEGNGNYEVSDSTSHSGGFCLSMDVPQNVNYSRSYQVVPCTIGVPQLISVYARNLDGASPASFSVINPVTSAVIQSVVLTPGDFALASVVVTPTTSSLKIVLEVQGDEDDHTGWYFDDVSCRPFVIAPHTHLLWMSGGANSQAFLRKMSVTTAGWKFDLAAGVTGFVYGAAEGDQRVPIGTISSALHCIGVTVDAFGNVAAYVDGVAIGSASLVAGAVLDTTEDIVFPAQNTPGTDVNVREYMFIRAALTADEIAAYHANTRTLFT